MNRRKFLKMCAVAGAGAAAGVAVCSSAVTTQPSMFNISGVTTGRIRGDTGRIRGELNHGVMLDEVGFFEHTHAGAPLSLEDGADFGGNGLRGSTPWTRRIHEGMTVVKSVAGSWSVIPPEELTKGTHFFLRHANGEIAGKAFPNLGLHHVHIAMCDAAPNKHGIWQVTSIGVFDTPEWHMWRAKKSRGEDPGYMPPGIYC